MVKLYDNITGQYLGIITDEDLQFLIDNLEEESLTDTEYYIDRPALDLLREKGMSEAFANLIETAMGGAGEVEIRYERES
jgi:processive 1,2-diacylglycerol beta-glucosyltransferase